MDFAPDSMERDLLDQRLANLRADLTMDKPVSKEDVAFLLGVAETMTEQLETAYQEGHDAGREETEELQFDDKEAEYDRGYEEGYTAGKEDAELDETA